MRARARLSASVHAGMQVCMLATVMQVCLYCDRVPARGEKKRSGRKRGREADNRSR